MEKGKRRVLRIKRAYLFLSPSMKQRTITAIFFTLTMLVGIYGGQTTFFILFSLITGGCAWELGQMAFRAETRFVRLRIVLCTILVGGIFVVMGGDMLHFWQISPMITTVFIPVVFTILAVLRAPKL